MMRSLTAAVKHGQQPAADRGAPHQPVFRLAVGDVMLAGVAGAVDDLARQQVQVLAQQRRDMLVGDVALNQPDQQRLNGRVQLAGFGRGEHLGDGLHSHQTSLNGLQVEDQLDADAGRLHVLVNHFHLASATGHDLLPGLERRRSGLRRTGRNQLFCRLYQLVEGRAGDP